MIGKSTSILSTHFFTRVRTVTQPPGQRCSVSALQGALQKSLGITTPKKKTKVIITGHFTVVVKGREIEINIIRLDDYLERNNDIYSFSAQCEFPMYIRELGIERKELFDAICYDVESDLSKYSPGSTTKISAHAIPGYVVQTEETMMERFVIDGAVITTVGFDR
jgi:hypothetical protein